MESAFLNLVKPLKVLADNWDIDIAAELSDYVGEVERVTQLQQTLDPTLLTQNDPLGVNFAQAALLIQNSAHVYSKKVQYLYNLTHEAHDYIFHGNATDATDQASTTTHAQTKDKRKQFMCLDECMVQKDCRLRKQDGTTVTTLPIAHGLVNKVFTELEIQEELIASNGERIGYRHEFEMNMGNLDDEGRLCIQSFLPFAAYQEAESKKVLQNSTGLGDDLKFEAQTIERENMLETIPEAPFETLVTGNECGMDMDETPPALESDDEMFHVNVDNDAMDIVEREQPVGTKGTTSPGPVTRNRVVVQDAQQQKPKEDPNDKFWTMLDPYEPHPKLMRPFRKSAISKTYRQVEKLVKKSEASRPLQTTVQQFLKDLADKSKADRLPVVVPQDSIRKLFYPEFNYIYVKALAKREQLLKRKQAECQQTLTELAVDVLENGESVEPYDVAPIEETPVFDIPDIHYSDAAVLPDDDLSDHETPIEPQWAVEMSVVPEDVSASTIPLAFQDEIKTLESPSEYVHSFESLCKLKIQNYLEQADEFEQQIESVLAKRVRKWENRLHPLLQEQNNRQQYNIELYREKVLEAVKHAVVPPLTKSKAKTTVEAIPFATIAEQGLQKYDVCRYFLASLHLANEGRLLISKRPEDDLMCVKPLK